MIRVAKTLYNWSGFKEMCLCRLWRHVVYGRKTIFR